MDRTIRSLLIIALTLVLTAQSANNPLAALAAQTNSPAALVLVPGTVTLPDDLAAALKDALAQAHADGTLTPLPFYAPSALQQESNWFFVSLVGLSQLDAGQTWNLERAAWIGLALLHRDSAGRWQGAVEGTAAFSTLLAAIPDTVVPARSKAGLDPVKRRQVAATETYRFPWEPGTNMYYGVLGVHDGGFATVVGNYKAVDFLSDANTSAGHAPNRLLAAASGTVTYRCYDGYSVAVRIGDLLYVHLLDNPNLVNNHYFNQGDELGQLKTGNFNYNCGYGSQGDNWFHVHWAFPDTGVFQAGGWTLDYRNVPAEELKNVAWQRGTQTRGPQQWFLADPVPPPFPAGWHIEYFSDKTLTTRCYDAYEDTPYLFKQWDSGPPATGCPADNFSVRFTRPITFAGGNYTFHIEHDDGARLYIDGQLALDVWASSGGHEVTRSLAGQHEVKVEYFDAGGFAALGAWWYGMGALPMAPVSDPNAWRAEYYGNRNLWGQPALVRNEAGNSIDHPWSNAGPGNGLPADDFSARFTRTVNFATGCYRFTARADDGLRLWVNGRLLFDQWWEQDASMQADIYLTGGAVPLKAEYYERGWGATLTLAWQPLPEETCARVGPDLRPYTPTGWSGPIAPSSVRGANETGALIAGQPTYFDWHFVNDGLTGTSNDFSVELWIDGERRIESTYTSIEPGVIGSVIDWAATLVAPGWHTVKLVIDPANTVPELNETNNTWVAMFYWQPATWAGQSIRTQETFLPTVDY